MLSLSNPNPSPFPSHSLSPCQLINSTRIVILPLINPDGRQLADEKQCTSTRGMANTHGKDLDTDFFGQLCGTLQVGQRVKGHQKALHL